MCKQQKPKICHEAAGYDELIWGFGVQSEKGMERKQWQWQGAVPYT